MEKGVNDACSHQSKPGGRSSSPSQRWKKKGSDSLKKTPFGKVSAASQKVEGGGTRDSSPSKVSKLLEAWEKGLVGMDATSPAPSAETRPSRSPVSTRRFLSPPEDAQSSHSTKNSFSSSHSTHAHAHAKRSLSPANAKQSFSSTGKRQPPFPEDARRSCSPDPWHPSGAAAEKLKSRSPTEKRRPPPLPAKPQPPPPLKAKPTRVPPSSAGSSRSCSPIGKDLSSRTDNHSFSSRDGAWHPSSLSGNPSSYSVADMRRFYSGGSTTWLSSPASSTVEIRRPLTSADRRSISPSSNTRRSPSPTITKCSSPSLDIRYPSPPPDNGWFSLCADARCPSPADVNCLPPPPDDLLLSAMEEECSCSPSPQRNFTAHEPVFSQVYSRLPRPKCLVKKEVQNGTSTTHCHAGGDAGFQKESHVTNSNGLFLDNMNETMPQKEGCMLNGDCSEPDTRCRRESILPGAIALQSSIENSPNTPSSTSFSGSQGRNYASSAPSPPCSEEPYVFKPVPQVVRSSTVGKSHTQWYGPKGSNTVVFRAQKQVIVPQPGCSTIYQVGREVVMSSPGSRNTSQGQQENLLAPSSITLQEENWPSQPDLPNAESSQRVHSSFPKSCIFFTPESQPENSMTHARNANVRDAQGPRCVLVQSLDRTSNREATIVREGIVPFNTAQRDGSLPSNSASQKHSNLFARSRSEQEQGMSNAGGPVTNGSDQDSSWLGVGEASLSANRRNKYPLDTAEEIGISAASQQTSPGNHKARTQDNELKTEKHVPGKGALIFAQEQECPPAGMLTSFSWPEPSSEEIRNVNQRAEQEPEESGEMEHFVDTLRNMDPADLRKPSNVISRPPRPSTLAKHTVLPPIDEYHITPKSKVAFPAAIGELFDLPEENSEEGTGSKREEPGLAEEDTEEIENPYLTEEEKSWDSSIGRRSSSWENQQYKTEEDSGHFLGNYQQSRGDIRANGIASNATVNQTHLNRANVLAGMSFLSNFLDRKAVEDKPHSRLDKSFLYSKFISPEKAESKALTQRKEMSPVMQKISRECQVSTGAPQEDAVHRSFPLAALRAGHHLRAPETGGYSKQIILLSKEAETLMQSQIQVSDLWLGSMKFPSS